MRSRTRSAVREERVGWRAVGFEVGDALANVTPTAHLGERGGNESSRNAGERASGHFGAWTSGKAPRRLLSLRVQSGQCYLGVCFETEAKRIPILLADVRAKESTSLLGQSRIRVD
jgi:hypothetical protein